jgi:hypothetical protein
VSESWTVNLMFLSRIQLLKWNLTKANWLENAGLLGCYQYKSWHLKLTQKNLLDLRYHIQNNQVKILQIHWMPETLKLCSGPPYITEQAVLYYRHLKKNMLCNSKIDTPTFGRKFAKKRWTYPKTSKLHHLTFNVDPML